MQASHGAVTKGPLYHSVHVPKGYHSHLEFSSSSVYKVFLTLKYDETLSAFS